MFNHRIKNASESLIMNVLNISLKFISFYLERLHRCGVLKNNVGLGLLYLLAHPVCAYMLLCSLLGAHLSVRFAGGTTWPVWYTVNVNATVNHINDSMHTCTVFLCLVFALRIA